MAAVTYSYQPDYAVFPGEILEEYLEVRGMSQAELARRCDRSPKLISQVLSGDAPVEPATALQLERVLGLDARVWLGIESDYRLHRQREMERQKLSESIEWAKQFPVADLVKRGFLTSAGIDEDMVVSLCSFFGVASVNAWRNNREKLQGAFRHSPTFDSNEAALFTWLRLGELAVKDFEYADYDEVRFRQSLSQIRKLTAETSVETLGKVSGLCRESGVALTIVKPLPGTALSGVSRWLSPGRPLIQLSARHLSDDHLWFSFFHEAAHILIHGKRDIFLHDKSNRVTEADTEADQWAANFLIPRKNWEQFVSVKQFSESAVIEFAQEQGIASGIVVGRLQHEKLLPWNRLNHLKMNLRWQEN